jgi:DEAD/DEAH box helicase domain-containing protein
VSIVTPAPPGGAPPPPGAETDDQQDCRALGILLAAQHAGQLVHLERIPGREGSHVSWPDWVPGEVAGGFARQGISRPWSHQAEAAELARSGQNVIIATRAASGKSAGYLAPALSAILEGGTVLYVAPTKALAADQLEAVRALGIPGVRAACYDGDSTAAERAWAQSHAGYLLTNPDMLHSALLPRHTRWSGFFKRLRYVIIDECHGYSGVFGSHVAHVLRRLRRVAAHYAVPGDSAGPVFVLASATISDPGACARLLTGLDVAEVTTDGSPRPPVTFALWEPPHITSRTAPHSTPGARGRRLATAEATDLLARLVAEQVPTLAFVRSRRGAEAVALAARRQLDDMPGSPTIAAYRSGYLPEDRRELEAALREGRLTGMAATTALELGINIPGLDAVLITGWPGTWASLWQQAGRAGRAGRSAVAVFIARDDPLDTYLIHHPEALLHHPLESTVLDPANPYVLAPHLCAAAAELPLSGPDLELFGPAAHESIDDLTRSGRLRRRDTGWYWARRDHPARLTSLRGTGPQPVRVVEAGTGRLIGTMDEPSAHLLAHDGAVYLHQGDTYLVSKLDLADRVALVENRDPGYTTTARDVTEVEVIGTIRQQAWGEADVTFGDVQVTRQVVSFTTRRSDTGFTVGETELSLPPRTLRTRAVWWTIPDSRRLELAASGTDLAGAAHAAEHAAIGMLPLFATCDRWDIGGVSAVPHPATGRLSVFVYDGHEGGAGFAERAFLAAADWLHATRAAIADCGCETGCPSCVQSPKCGNGNNPLSKTGAIVLLDALLSGTPSPEN